MRKAQGTTRRGYDIPMIRDFFEHLTWEARVRHTECVGRPGAVNPELVEQLAKYIKRRKTVGLLMANRVTPDPTGAVSHDRAMAALGEHNAAQAQAWVDALEALRPLLEEALYCAGRPDTFLVRSRTALQVMNELGQGPDAAASEQV